MFFVDKLVAMGARIILCDPHCQIERGYEDLASRLGRLGALIRTEEA